MIKSKQDYKFYLEADRIALNVKRQKPRIIGDEIWKFQRLLRKAEYLENCAEQLRKLDLWLTLFKLHNVSLKLGFQIPRNVFGPGLSIAHYGPIVISKKAKLGSNCRIHHCVTIGVKAGQDLEAPTIGDNVFIGPGAVLVGGIVIADGIAIGANSYVDKSFLEKDITIAGNPARKISNVGSERLYHRATEILQVKITK